MVINIWCKAAFMCVQTSSQTIPISLLNSPGVHHVEIWQKSNLWRQIPHMIDVTDFNENRATHIVPPPPL